MRLIKPNVEILEQKSGLDGIYKQIELAGRTCYKSEDKITEDSAKAFVDRMIASGHGAMLEHGTVYLTIPHKSMISKYTTNKYSKVCYDDTHKIEYVTTNYRVLVENNWLDDLQYVCEPTEHHEKRITVRWTLDRVTGESFLRHRVFSFARESTRYCNYSKDKFGNEITFIIPTWMDTIKDGDTFSYDTHIEEWQKSEDANTSNFLQSIAWAEKNYLTLIHNGWKPQQARQVLPFSVHSPLVMTGFESDWKHFFSLRSPKYGAKGVHPDAAYLADKLYDMLYVEKDSDFSVMHCDAFDGENPLLNDGDMITYHSGYDKNKNSYTLLGITIKSKDGETLYMNREEYYKLKEFQVEKEEEFLKNTRKQNRELCNNLQKTA